MAKDRTTFARQQREMEKKRKAAAKRERRRIRKEEPQDPVQPDHATSDDAQLDNLQRAGTGEV